MSNHHELKKENPGTKTGANENSSPAIVSLHVVEENSPDVLKHRPQWLVWRLEERDEKPTKVPYDAKTGRRGKSNDPSTWADFDTALSAYRSGGYSGVGFAFVEGDGLVGIDLDHVVDPETGDISESWALEVKDRLSHTYVERSPSGTGLRIFAIGQPGRCGKGTTEKRIEVYDASSPRFLTVTGHRECGGDGLIAEAQEALDWLHREFFAPKDGATASKPVSRGDSTAASPDDQEIIRRATGAANGGKFRALLSGEWQSQGYPSQSEADGALCSILAFWTRDPAQIDRIFRSSGLMRPKWDERHHANGQTYGDGTIQSALRTCARSFGDRRKEGDARPADPSMVPASEASKAGGTPSLFEPNGRPKSRSTLLIELASPWEVFHDADRNGYIVLLRDGIREVHPIRTTAFRQWLNGAFFALTGKGCSNTAVADALDTIEARAVYAGPKASVYLRIAHFADRIVIDLSNDRWQAVEVTKTGWSVLDTSPVNFIRKRGMAPLPIPEPGGRVEELRQFLNVMPDEFELAVGWLLSALGGKGPYPVLVLQGEQGTGKSTTSRILRSLVDPSTVPLRSPPREPRDLLVSAANSHLVVLDNLSGLSPELSDCLCRFATGGGMDMRQLYTNQEQVLIEIQRPTLVNGIDDIASRPDLAERAVLLNLPVIEGTKRRDENIFWTAFEAARPKILGALLDALAGALARAPATHLTRKPRMADFAVWVTAAEPALGWTPGAFMAAYDRNQDEAVDASIDASPVGSTLVDLLAEHEGAWTGSPTELLNVLEHRAGRLARSRAWPQSTKGLKNALKRLKPSLRRRGILIEEGRTERSRFYRITWDKADPSDVSEPSAAASEGPLGLTDGGELTEERPALTVPDTEPSSPEPLRKAA
jgi:hypothetical protein